MKRIFIDRDKCQGCLTCQAACMAEHNPAGKSIYDLDMSSPANTVNSNIMADDRGRPTPVFCRHCDDPDCARACMSGAMRKHPESGLVAHDRDRCASCYMCLMSCRFGVLKVDIASRRIIQKCDYCGDRKSPRCVEECPSEAILFLEAEA